MFVGAVGGGCFSVQWVVVFCENVILLEVVLLKNTVLWVCFVQMGSCWLFGFKYTEEWEKNSPNSLRGGSPDVGGGVDWYFDLMGGGPKQYLNLMGGWGHQSAIKDPINFCLEQP